MRRALASTLAVLAALSGAHEARAACARPTDAAGYQGFVYDTPTDVEEGARVRVHYARTGRHALGGGGAPTTPPLAAAVARVADETLARLAGLGYRAPVRAGACASDASGRLDVYLVAFAGADGHAARETCAAEAPGAAETCATFVLAARDLDVRYGDAERGARIVVAHEAFHAVQAAYAAEVAPFFSEGSAQWATDALFPGLGDLERNLPAFFADPARPLDSEAGGVTTSALYAAAIWPVFLARRYGAELVRETLEGCARGRDALDATDEALAARGGALGDAFGEMATWNAATGARAPAGDDAARDALGYADAARYPEVALEDLAPGSTREGVTSGLGARYFRARGPGLLDAETLPDASRAFVVPLVGGRAVLGATRRAEGSVEIPGEAVVVIAGAARGLADAPYRLTLRDGLAARAPDAPATARTDAAPSAGEAVDASAGGCALAAGGSPRRSPPALAVALLVAAGGLFGARRRATLRRLVRAHRAAPLVALAVLLGTAGAPGCKAGSGAATTGEGPGDAAGDASAPAALRVVTVGSAVTEAAFAVGAGAVVVGVDTSSLFPEEATRRPRVGYQRALAAEGLLSLAPTLVLATDEAGPESVLEQLRARGVRVERVGSAPTLDGARARLARVAELLGRPADAALARFDDDARAAKALVARTTQRPRVLALYARGAGTLQVFGRETAADGMLALAGADNAVTAFTGAKPLTAEALVAAAPDVVLVPARGLESLGGEAGLLAVPGVAGTPAGRAKRIVAVDDLLLLGFGPRTGEAVALLARALHPELAGDRDAGTRAPEGGP